MASLAKQIFNKSPVFIRSYSKMMETILVKKEGKVTTFGINRPEKRNCINSLTAESLKSAIEDFENDDEAYVGVLHGIGGNFCAGYDLSELSQAQEVDNQIFHKPTGYMGPTLRHIKKPIIGAISGYAVAGGFELALMCDLRIMEENAVMGVFCRRFGVPLMDGGTVRLQAIVGLTRAMDLILTGRAIGAKEAMDWGLVNRTVALGTSYGQAVGLANSLVKFPQVCMNVDRDSTYNAAYCQVYDELLKRETEAAVPVLTKESIEGAQRFVSGVGRHGSFRNLTTKPIPDWESKENELLKNKL